MAAALILKIRAEALRANLKDLKSHLRNMPDPKANLFKLENRLTDAKRSLANVLKTVSNTRIELEGETNASHIAHPLEETEQQLRIIITSLRDAGTLIESMRKKCNRIYETEI